VGRGSVDKILPDRVHVCPRDKGRDLSSESDGVAEEFFFGGGTEATQYFAAVRKSAKLFDYFYVIFGKTENIFSGGGISKSFKQSDRLPLIFDVFTMLEEQIYKPSLDGY
jgi:hypothetical protein